MSKNAKIVTGLLAVLALLVIAFGMTSGRLDGTPAEETDTSDQTLRDDAAAIDAELEGLEGDRAMIDQGLEENVSAQ